jgi:hypothetical protein
MHDRKRAQHQLLLFFFPVFIIPRSIARWRFGREPAYVDERMSAAAGPFGVDKTTLSGAGSDGGGGTRSAAAGFERDRKTVARS